MLKDFFEMLAQPGEATRVFVIFATVSLLAFGVLSAMTGKLVVDAWRRPSPPSAS